MRELERDMNPINPVALGALAVVGPGRLGQAISRGAQNAGIAVALADRDGALEVCRRSKAALLCVPDAAIAGACESIAGAVPPLRFVGHTSGATELGALAAAARRGAATFSLHPLQTVPDGADAALAGAPCAIAGSTAEAIEVAAAIARGLEMKPFEIPEGGRAAYHAAATIASNFLVTLEESAAELMERAGIEGGRELLGPLVLHTAANWAKHGGDALTGPIARGDETTVQSHLEALSRIQPGLIELYEALAERTRELAREGAAA
jgi:predicted short-subunit dehydrogenase-like oxidoreductase (DUF2520 family)